jgi:hypothetical protein
MFSTDLGEAYASPNSSASFLGRIRKNPYQTKKLAHEFGEAHVQQKQQ